MFKTRLSVLLVLVLLVMFSGNIAFARPVEPPSNDISFIARQGGDDTNWRIPGNVTYTPENVVMQAGTLRTEYSSEYSRGVGVFVQFPIPFSAPPIFIVQQNDYLPFTPIAFITDCTNGTECAVWFYAIDQPFDHVEFSWIAIGHVAP